MAQKQFLAASKAHIENLIERVEKVCSGLSDEELSTNHSSGEWGAGMILDHVNMLLDVYEPVIKKTISSAPAGSHETAILHKPFMKFFIKMAGPEGNPPAPKSFHSKKETFSQADVKKFVEGHQQVMQFIDEMENVKIMEAKFKNPALSIITMTLADYVALMASHGERHVRQIEERVPDIIGSEKLLV